MKSTLGALSVSKELDCPLIVTACVNYLEAVTWEEGSCSCSAQEQIEYMITEDDDAPLLIADEVIKLEVKECVKSLMVVSDLSWAFQILAKMEMVRDFLVTWVETSEKLVEAMETAAEKVEIKS
ncbi:BTB/POZ domain-containing protein [Raphanus sativus]|nr:BTB/POZ domain-containing protein [Raphanus sativus]